MTQARANKKRNLASAQTRVAYLLLLPFFVLFILFFIVPLLYSFRISLYLERLVSGVSFVGWQNYVQVFQDPKFWEGLGRMAVFGLVQVPVMLALALLFALLLDGSRVYFPTLFRLGYFLPYAVPSVVATLLWSYLLGNRFGPFAQIADALGLPEPRFLTRSGILFTIGNIVTWQYLGSNMVILDTALKSVPRELFDAAKIDGASWWRTAFAIKIPLIAPTLMLITVLSIIGTLQLFSEAQLLRQGAPSIIADNYTPNLYAYALAFTNQQYNYAAAVTFVLGLMIVIASVVFSRLVGRRS